MSEMNAPEPDGLEGFHPTVAHWFRTRIGQPTSPQRLGWPEIAAGRSALITAPTGAGKTLAAFLVALNELLQLGLSGDMPEGVHVLYVSPLKALNNDISRNLEAPLSEIRAMCLAEGIPFPDIRKAVRTGDTSPSERQAMLKKPPHILITTPESLFLLLTSTKASLLLKGVKYLIVDEIHAVFGSKRGTHLSLSMERLAAAAAPGLIRIGLSATVRPYELASRFLGGYDALGKPCPVTLVAPELDKLKDLRIALPVPDFRSLEAGSVWPDIYDTVERLVKAHTATIVFVNNRATAERIAANVNDLAGEELCVPHHGSLSRERRQLIEARFKSGDLRCMVATATLELGIDIGQVDLMIQISAPITISGGLQRLGRAGHRLDAVSRGRIIPKTRGDLLKSLYVAQEMEAGQIEATRLPREPLDVLAQHLVSMSCTGRWTETDLLAVIRRSASYHELRESDLRRVLSMLSGDYEHKEDIPAKPRLMWDRINGVVEGTPYSRMLAVSAGGTIPDRGMFPVVLADGRMRIGELDEEYVFESRQGDVFMLGNTPWRMEKIERDRVVVTPAASTHGAETPFWRGDGLGMPLEQGLRYGRFVRTLEERLLAGTLVDDLVTEGLVEERGAENLVQYLLDQREAAGCLPSDRQVVMETVADGDAGVTIILHALFGGRVNATLEALLRNVLEETLHLSVYTTHTDEIILIYLYGVPDEVPSLFPLLSPEGVERTLLRILPSTSRFSIAFRYNAYRALMMGTRKHGTRLPLWIQRLRSVEALEQAVRSADHPLLVETMRECMEDAFDLRGTAQILTELAEGRIAVVPVKSWYPSPFASEVMLKLEGDLLYTPAASHPGGIRKPVVSGMDILHLEQDIPELPALDPEAVRQVTEANRPEERFRNARSANEVHSLLLVYGDLLPEMGEMADQGTEMLAFLQELEAQQRVLKTTVPVSRWIAREEKSLYAAAEPEAWNDFGNGENTTEERDETFREREEPDASLDASSDGLWSREEAAVRIIRRYSRYVGPFSEKDVLCRYAIAPALVQQVLGRLEQDRFLVQISVGESSSLTWCHRTLWERMRRLDLRTRTGQVQGAPAAAYAAMLPGHQLVLPACADKTDMATACAGGDRISPPLSGTAPERLLSVLRLYSGMPFPAAWWEDILLPARVPGYSAGMLDRLCTTGRIFWRAIPVPGEKALSLAFYDPESLTELPRSPSVGESRQTTDTCQEGLPVEAERILSVLAERGACFTHQLTSVTGIPVTGLLGGLHELVARGLAANDSFAPIRLFLEWNKARNPSAFTKRLAMMTARMEMGRWERVYPVQPEQPLPSLERWFSRWGMACREIADLEVSPSWSEAYELLKSMEFAGKAHRGLFYEELSGIQFLPGATAPYQLSESTPLWHVLAACDPALAYGRIVPHAASKLDFSRVPGTVVVMRNGVPLLVLDRSGTGFRTLLAGDALEQALTCLIRAFQEKHIWPSEHLLCVKTDTVAVDTVPDSKTLREALEHAGFETEPSRMVLRRKTHR